MKGSEDVTDWLVRRRSNQFLGRVRPQRCSPCPETIDCIPVIRCPYTVLRVFARLRFLLKLGLVPHRLA